MIALLFGSTALAQTPTAKSAAAKPVEKSEMFKYVPGTLVGYFDEFAGKKKILLLGDTHTGNQNAHDAVSHALATLERSLTQAGYAPFIKTDTQWITRDEVWGKNDYAKGGSKAALGRNLNDFAAVVFYTNGDTDMTPKQKADLMSWLKDGKGLVGVHTAATTMLDYPPYRDMLGATFDNHAWGIVNADVIVERPDFPGMLPFVLSPRVYDEHYVMTEPYSRKNVDVLMRLDPKSVDLNSPNLHRTDNDFAMAWIKNYGKGRVFYSSFGHSAAIWDDPRVQNMYVQAVRWAAGDLDFPVRPHPMTDTPNGGH
jgi:type 1 glutamine amidotransferase